MLYLKSALSAWFKTDTWLTFAQQLQVTPQYFSIGHLQEELVLAERTEVSPGDVNAAYFHLVDIKLFHHPHGPVDHLVGWPEDGIWRGGDKARTLTRASIAALLSHTPRL